MVFTVENPSESHKLVEILDLRSPSDSKSGDGLRTPNWPAEGRDGPLRGREGLLHKLGSCCAGGGMAGVEGCRTKTPGAVV